uniref:Prenyltransferase alpha-alpha toroid domain-containing protein n=1 Tax=Pseudo-nitzschia australis TaxID=44445 RepID=A0A6U9ZJC4_9STRA|mmetsp:Transcript_23023/g.50198  ORF Transcript_23023/g.50198 Transcript_23023/m.50198 type:complete len:655 (+) Transcript_23023:228-2192(+)|eukprot:CAMPEP_0168178658 /NCGR_PEP_ID=MMETSP0139_2-20121125/9309_1 /TAXON_ID=44445 /ORGANISM="Pseudo-nitzschia australis, Strain 10249 10 AB" /LENGTH=654 /DNA_ID=CAMNT_0008098199 /DNA_START=303 /DNA_END=2267 /DNA_ORIENTATION=+
MSKNSNKPPTFCLIDTETTILQKQTEKECQPYFVDLSALPPDQKQHLQQVGLLKEPREGEESDNRRQPSNPVQLLREKHRAYLEGVWKKPLKAPFVSLDSSRPWMLYWCLHAYDLLSGSSSSNNSSSNSNNAGNHAKKKQTSWITGKEGTNMVSTLEDCWHSYHTPHPQIPTIVNDNDELYFVLHEDDEHRNGASNGANNNDNQEARYYCGGFGGGPGQMAHAATTYAAVLALCILATCSKDNDDDDDSEDENENENHDENHDDDDDYDTLHYSEKAGRILQEIRIPLYRWMASLQVPETGGYRMQHDGEVDVRATYTIACCSKLLGLLEINETNSGGGDGDNSGGSGSSSDQQQRQRPKRRTVLGRPLVIDFVRSCQTYEGGMGGEPFSEAHGGYTLCAVAALKLLGALHDHDPTSTSAATTSTGTTHGLDVSALIGWLSRRQTTYEGGFAGRCNKLVDGCYSFWQGGAVAIASSSSGIVGGDGDDDCRDRGDDPWLRRYNRNRCAASSSSSMAATPTPTPSEATTNGNNNNNLPFPLLYNVFLLERYILLCAQEITGGLRDKPSKPRDFYHTCYNLSGLSIAQHCSSSSSSGNGDNPDHNDDDDKELDTGFGDAEQTLVEMTHPCYNIRIDRVAAIMDIEWGKGTNDGTRKR